MGITNPSIRRIARRGGVKRISSLVYNEARWILRDFLIETIRDSVTYMEHAKRKTLTALDVIYALKRKNRMIYGFEYGIYQGRFITNELLFKLTDIVFYLIKSLENKTLNYSFII